MFSHATASKQVRALRKSGQGSPRKTEALFQMKGELVGEDRGVALGTWPSQRPSSQGQGIGWPWMRWSAKKTQGWPGRWPSQGHMAHKPTSGLDVALLVGVEQVHGERFSHPKAGLAAAGSGKSWSRERP